MNFNLSSTLLDACVLSILVKEPTYGYKLTQEVRQLMEVSESTLYPVLRRLQLNDFLTTYDESFMGRNRRYYQITNQGKIHLQRSMLEWEQFKRQIDSVLKGE